MVGDFILAFLLLGGVLLVLLLKSAQKDRKDSKAEAARTREELAAAQEEARKYQDGVGLVCLSCGTHFRGPLTETGCPHCHLSSLVMTETQYEATQYEATQSASKNAN